MEIRTIAMPPANALDRIAGAAFGSTRNASGSDFASLIRQSLAHVDAMQGQAETRAARCRPAPSGGLLDGAVRSMQTADIGDQTTVQVRDKLVAAYNDIMNMPL